MEVNGSIQFSADGLRPIFDLLPRDANDRVKITDFIDLLRDYVDSQMLESMIQQFNTDNSGCVTFSEFCTGVQKMSNDSLVLLAKPVDVSSQESNECNSRVPSDVSTFNEYDVFTDDDQVDAGNSAPLFTDTFTSSLNDSKSNPFHEEYVKDLREKVVMLESEIEHMTNSHRTNDETTSRVKEENTALIQRVHTLEDLLEDLDLQSRQRLEEETTKRQQTLRRLEKERSSEVDLLTDRLQLLERDYSQLSEELPILRADNRRLAAEVTVKQHELSAVQADCEAMAEINTRLRSELDTSRHDATVQLSVKQQLIEELTRELDDVRHHHGDSQSERSVRRQELEQQLVRLKEENAYLREHTEDLEDQLNCMSSGQSLWINGAVNQSLAQEIDGLSKDELITALKDQQRLSESLRDYIDMLTARVLEVNPTLLEVNSSNNRKR